MVIGAAALGWSWVLAPDQGHAFWAGFLQNVAAEAIGLGVGVPFALWVASALGKERLSSVAPKLVEVVKELREQDTLSGRAARACVVCAVELIDDKELQKSRGANPNLRFADCAVCKLPSNVVPEASGGSRCRHCGLRGDVWMAKLERHTRAAT